MPKKINHETYIQELLNKKINIEPLEEYRGSLTKIKHKCECGNIWEVGPSSVLLGKRCGCKKINNYHGLETYKKEILFYTI